MLTFRIRRGTELVFEDRERATRFCVSFYRTLRVPDDGRSYFLPAGMGPFPIRRVRNYADRVPRRWLDRDGVLIPMYQREALWLGFSSEHHHPNAVKVGSGMINALSGKPWDRRLGHPARPSLIKRMLGYSESQDYLVSPPQTWLDGFNTGHGTVRQLVAMPLGMGVTVEAQLTGQEAHGGLQILVYQPHKGRFPTQHTPLSADPTSREVEVGSRDAGTPLLTPPTPALSRGTPALNTAGLPSPTPGLAHALQTTVPGPDLQETVPASAMAETAPADSLSKTIVGMASPVLRATSAPAMDPGNGDESMERTLLAGDLGPSVEALRAELRQAHQEGAQPGAGLGPLDNDHEPTIMDEGGVLAQSVELADFADDDDEDKTVIGGPFVSADQVPAPLESPTAGASPAASSEPGEDSLIGQVLGTKYEILQRVGEGWLGPVYKARHVALDRLVAIKLLHPQIAQDPDWMEALHGELKACAQLQHPNTARTFEVGQARDGRLFVAMEFVDGQSLREHIAANGPLPPEDALRVLIQCCASLAEAHIVGVLHADIKPDNVFLMSLGQSPGLVKLLDFAVKRTMMDQHGQVRTRAGVMMARPKYMSPEQVRGEEIDARCDLYCVGTLAYEMLTGRVPFEDGSLMSEATKLLFEPPPPLPEAIPEPVRAVVSRALQKDPAMRFQSAEDMMRECELVLGQITGSRSARDLMPGPVFAPGPGPGRADPGLGPMPRAPGLGPMPAAPGPMPRAPGLGPMPAAPGPGPMSGPPSSGPAPAAMGARRRLKPESFSAKTMMPGQAPSPTRTLADGPVSGAAPSPPPPPPPPPFAAPSLQPAQIAPQAVPAPQARAMGLAAGGQINQKIHPDPYGVELWDESNFGEVFVYLVNSEDWHRITGEHPPRTPISAANYREAGYVWLEHWEAESGDIAPAAPFKHIKSLGELDPKE